MNVISKPGLLELVADKPRDVQRETIAWYKVARNADWDGFGAVRMHFPDADWVNGLLVFNIRFNRYRLIVFPVFSRRKLYLKALLTHKEYMREEWKTQWP